MPANGKGKGCDTCTAAGDIMCITIGGERVYVIDADGAGNVLSKDPARIAQAVDVAKERLGRLASVAVEAQLQIGIYSKALEDLAVTQAAGEGGASA